MIIRNNDYFAKADRMREWVRPHNEQVAWKRVAELQSELSKLCGAISTHLAEKGERAPAYLLEAMTSAAIAMVDEVAL